MFSPECGDGEEYRWWLTNGVDFVIQLGRLRMACVVGRVGDALVQRWAIGGDRERKKCGTQRGPVIVDHGAWNS